MAKNSLVVHLDGDSKGLQKSLDSARQAVNGIQSDASKLKSIQKKFDDITASTDPLKKKLRDIRKAMEQMAVSGIDATDEGLQMWKRLSDSAKQYDDMLKRIQNDTRNVGDSSSSNSSNFDIKGIGTDLLNKSGMGGVASALGTVSSMINPVTVGITAVGTTMIQAGKATAEFETHLNSLQALTGLSDSEIKEVGKSAIDLSKNFSSSASEIVDSMKLIGSQAPELLKDKDALLQVTEAANVLSEAAEISVEDSAKAITGVMNQMGASASEATDIINTLAAASQQGSADVAYLNKAFEKSGTAASSAGMDYVELASMVESIAPKFSSADVAGSQLASTLLKLSMSGNSDFMPSVVGMSKALENLSKAEMDDAQMKNLVGESNITMLKSLIDAREQFDSYSQSLRGTSTAYEQMETNQKGMLKTIERLKSQWEAFLLVLGESAFMQTLGEEIEIILKALGEMVGVVSDVIDSFSLFEGIGDDLSFFRLIWENLVDTVKKLGIAIEIVVAIFAKCWNTMVETVRNATNYIKNKWDETTSRLSDNRFVQSIVKAFNTIYKKFQELIVKIQKAWNKTMEWLGLDKHKVVIKVDGSEIQNEDNNSKGTSSTPSNTPNISSPKNKSKNAKNTKNDKIDYLVSVDDGSLDVAEKKLQAWQNKLKITPITDKEAITKCKDEVDKWKKEVETRKIQLGLAVDKNQERKIEDGSLNNIKKRIKEKENEINLALDTKINPESMRKLQSELESLRKEQESKEIELGLKTNSPTVHKSDKKFERGTVEDKKQSLSNAKSMVREIQENYHLKLIGKDEVKSQLSEINKQLESLGLKPINLTFNDDGTLTTAEENLIRYKEQMQSVGDVTSSIGNVFGSLGSAISGTTGEVMNFAGQSISAIGQIIPQIVSLITAKEAEAMASGTASAASMPFPANIAAIASIVATLVGVFASLPKFECGGIVGGSSFTGDRLLARVNSGEMILNKSQQKNLYDSMNNSVIAQPRQSILKGDVNFSISGSSLKGCLKNYDSKMSRIK